ncbi:MAG: cell division protein FtsA [Prevotellaceae bacterium]|nr:cell division protein FtsA [Prevotellaceae bacterium]
MAKDFVVAIELGSSKMTGIAGKKNADGSINVLAMSQEDSSAFIRKGYVYNIDKTAAAISNIVTDLSSQLKTQIKKVYVGIGGQSVRSYVNEIKREFPTETKITQNMVYDLMDANRATRYPEQEILDVVVQEYKVNNQLQIDPAGIECTKFEGKFLNIIYRSSFYKSLANCFATAGVHIEEPIPAPLAMAEAVLTDAERRSGCVLVDLGADTTTVVVYYKNILRHVAVIPIGSRNITKDIASLQLDEDEAEAVKLKYAVAYTDNADIDLDLEYPIAPDRSVESQKFIEIVESRLTEIIENVKSQIPQEYEGKLMAGYILTGGGSNMRKIEVAFSKLAQTNKIRIAKNICGQVFSKIDLASSNNGTLNVALGLMIKGNENCAGDEIIIGDLFGATPVAPIPEEPAPEPEPEPYEPTPEPEPEPEPESKTWGKGQKGRKGFLAGVWETIKKMVEEEE